MSTQRYFKTQVIAQRQADFMSERMTNPNSEPEIIHRWLSDVCLEWMHMMNAPYDEVQEKVETSVEAPQWSEDEYYRFIVGITKYLAFRDAIILTAMRNLPEAMTLDFLRHPTHRRSTMLVHEILASLINDVNAQPDSERLSRCMDILDAIKILVPEKYHAPFYGIQAYLLWASGEFSKALTANKHALNQDRNYTLSLITGKALDKKIYPAWCVHAQCAKNTET